MRYCYECGEEVEQIEDLGSFNLGLFWEENDEEENNENEKKKAAPEAQIFVCIHCDSILTKIDLIKGGTTIRRLKKRFTDFQKDQWAAAQRDHEEKGVGI